MRPNISGGNVGTDMCGMVRLNQIPSHSGTRLWWWLLSRKVWANSSSQTPSTMTTAVVLSVFLVYRIFRMSAWFKYTQIIMWFPLLFATVAVPLQASPFPDCRCLYSQFRRGCFGHDIVDIRPLCISCQPDLWRWGSSLFVYIHKLILP